MVLTRNELVATFHGWVQFMRGALGYIRNRKTEEKNHPKPQNRKFGDSIV